MHFFIHRIFLLCFLLAVPVAAQTQTFVHRQGNTIADSSGRSIELNGVNLGGWLMWEGWIWGKGFVRQSRIYDQAVKAAGAADAANFRQKIYENMITQADIRQIKACCFNTVRVPFNHLLLEDDAQPGIYKNEGWKRIDSLLAWCEKNQVYVILDLHGSPGGNSGFFTADPDPKKLWQDEKNILRTSMLWKAIAARYKDRKIIAGYDLLNEPGFPDGKMLLRVYQQIIDSIRTVDRHHLLFLEGNKLATDFSMFSKLPDENAAFSFHVYTFFNKKEKNIRKKISASVAPARTLNAPIWCGEWGENDMATLEKTMQILSEKQYNISGSTIWTWKKVMPASGGNPALNEITVSEDWRKMIKWLSGKGKQPPVDFSKKAMLDFTEAVKSANNKPNTPLLKILARCQK